ncbi:MAG: hypothetical protein LPJ89_02820 [Hymenobacteraceae bacterium]|nr:hypothetical protein [Hymenobacteraceae bacterium]MDX5397945.1 hypothetical protein [Hymenobacteraceae bacterium]MDX5442698.1 hypothetical protein [Hymenobacteraceae bacterium]MDX5514017.1 hypothetical protein [Hymenobacteraceae bacterium]
MNLFKNIFYKLTLFIASLFIFSSCSTDLDPNAEYKEIMVIYSLLDPTETTHFVKVNKAFLNTNSNALTIAANSPDSTTYAAGVLQVELQKLRKDSSVVQSYPLSRTVITNKEPGTFSYPDQVVYKVENVQLDDNFIYRVKATNQNSGLTAYGSTEIVKPFCVTQISSAPFSCADTALLQDYRPEVATSVRYNTAEGGAIYKVTMHLTYRETSNGNTVTKTVRWDVTTDEPRQHAANNIVRIGIDQYTFYERLLTLVDRSNDNATTTREIEDITFTFTAGSQVLANYYLVNNSFSVFSQTLPEYDNIVNGTGLVASRRKVLIDARLDFRAVQHMKNAYPQLRFQ